MMLAFPVLLLSQAYFGTVAGLLTDPTGAVIPGVKLTLTDVERGYTFTTTTNKAGEFVLPSIPPSVYTLTAEMNGFNKAVRTGIKVDVASHVTVNMSLKVAGATQTVQVSSQNTSLQTQDATTGQVINKRFIEGLPLIDRYVLNLVALAPGVHDVDSTCGLSCTGTNFISNGSRNATADILSDGASITNIEPNGGITNVTYTPSVASVQEFKVQQTNFSAEYGFSGGSIINMITQSGTNVFHGSAYDFVRNQILDANDWFSDHYGQPIPGLSRNEYGGTIGGPIFKNKTFFFFDYDGTIQNTQENAQSGVPSAAERTGDFGEVCGFYGGTFNAAGLCSVPQGQIWDPYSGTYNSDLGGAVASAYVPFNNMATYASPGSPYLAGTPYQLSGAPGDLIDPVAQKMMNLFPLPNINNGNIYDNWIASGVNESTAEQYDIKIDQRFRQSNLLTGKWSQAWSHSSPYNCFGNYADPCAGGPNSTPVHVIAIDDTQTFSPTLLLDVTLGFTRGAETINNYPPNGTKNPPADPLSALGFPEYLNSTGFLGVPSMFIGGGYFNPGYQSIGGDPYGNYRQGQDTGQLTVTLTKQLGTQELKFGFDGRLHQMNYIQTNAPNGFFSFDEGGTAQCPNAVANCGGDAMATFMLGYPNLGGFYEIQDRIASENFQYAGYAQDNWRVTNKLTVNLGLRYEVVLPRTERFNRQNWFDPNVTSPLQVPGVGPSGGTGPLVGGEVFASPSQRKIIDTDWNDWQPRFGFAYQFSPKWVVRGGWGVYYSQSRAGVTGVGPYGTQGFNQYTNMITTYQNAGDTPWTRLSNPFPNGLILPPGNSLGLLNDVGFGAVGPIRTEKTTPSEESWSLGIEHQLPWNVLLDVEYIGKKGTNLYFGGDNQIDILPASVENYTPDQVGDLLNAYVNNPFQGFITNPNSTLSQSQVQQYQLELPYPQFTSVTTDIPPIASSIYNSLQITSQKNFSQGLQFLLTYVWSKSIDDSSAQDDNTTWLGSFVSLQDPNKPYLERSLSTFDVPQVFQASYVYALPFGRGRRFLGNSSRLVDAFLGGWNTNGIWRISGGYPLAMTTYDGTSLPTYGAQRPNIIGTPQRNHGHNWINNFFTNPGVFVLPPLYAIGDAPRTIGTVRTPYFFDADLSLMKVFSLDSLRKGASIEARIEAQNAFNHPTFGTPDTSVDDPNFGVISSTRSTPRQVQLGVKATF
ncbi:MAG TPA: TonB-dependent receptor [Acidobacteriaceae bacterium]|nr:TonB-dependent receptor [Acidobacteriaceae bacterium]